MHTIKVKGMHCAHCEALIAEELKEVGATQVQADAATGIVHFEGDLTPQAIMAAVSQAGFELDEELD